MPHIGHSEGSVYSTDVPMGLLSTHRRFGAISTWKSHASQPEIVTTSTPCSFFSGGTQHPGQGHGCILLSCSCHIMATTDTAPLSIFSSQPRPTLTQFRPSLQVILEPGFLASNPLPPLPLSQPSWKVDHLNGCPGNSRKPLEYNALVIMPLIQ